MALFWQHQEPGWRWGVWKMEETYEELCALLPHAVVMRAEQSFSSLHRRQEWLSVRALLAQCAGSGVQIGYLPSGKPYLNDDSAFISISHTRGYVAVMLGEKPLGIDIEQYGARVHKVASRFMREDERAGTWQEDDTWGLLLHWSAKEAMFKCLGEQEVDFREHLRILPFEIREKGEFLAHECKTAACHGFRGYYWLHADFVLTAVTFL